jgi:hypothetical protein
MLVYKCIQVAFLNLALVAREKYGKRDGGDAV